MTLRDSLNYQPVELSFGTSGLRGLVRDMTDLECYINTAGFLQFLVAASALKPGEKIYIAGDLRATTPRIMQAAAAAIIDSGYEPVNCGKIPTPALAYYAQMHDAPCIMITGSHIPADRNGIKFYRRDGEVLKQDEAGIHEAVARARASLYSQDAARAKFGPDGALKQLPELSGLDSQAEAVYKKRYIDVFPADSLAGKQIVVYQQSSVARDLLVEVLQALGANVVPIERSDEFIPIDTENITDEERQRFRAFATKYTDSFAIISADGDSDRPMVIDEEGIFHRGDVLGCLVADYLGVRFAAAPVSVNDAVDQYLAARGVPFIKTKIGSPYVIAAMQSAPSDQRPTASWEVNGGFLLGDDTMLNSKVLHALPTRDALLPILCILAMANQAATTLSGLFKRLPRRYTGAGLVDDVPEAQIAAFRSKVGDLEVMRKLAGRLFDGGDMGTVTDVNVTDGLRLRFSSNDVIHFRPSGNAPQFRVYTNADSQDRATDLVENALKPGGYLEELLAALGV